MAKENTGLTVGDERIEDEAVQHAGFTDTELAALKEGEEEGEAAEGEGEGEEGAAEGEEAEGEGAEGEGAAEGEEGAEGEGADAGEGEGEGAEGEGEAETETDPATVIAEDDPELLALQETRLVAPSEWTLPDGGVTKARENIGNLQQQEKELADKFDAGDLTATEYREQSRDVINKISDLRADVREAERAFSRAMTHWSEKTVAKFLRDNPEWSANETMLRVLDTEVQAQQNKSADPFDPRHLLAASRAIKSAMGLTGDTKVQARKPAPGKPAAAAKPGNRIPPGKRAEVPPTLARVPADEISDTDGGKFARLDRLQATDPLAWQEALGKMSEADREQYGAA